MNVLIVPDKFKGTLTARQAAEAIARGWGSVRPQDSLELLPMSDGGDGFGEIISGLLGAQQQNVRTVDAAHRPLGACWWWSPRSHTAIIESARVIGLALLPKGKYHPFELDTFGLGALLNAAAKAGAQRCLVGVGGSATNDAGFGMARALGWTFLDSDLKPIENWIDLGKLDRICPPTQESEFGRLAGWQPAIQQTGSLRCEDEVSESRDRAVLAPKITVAVDVQNPFLGPTGCTRIYGPQKGLRPEDFALAESCLSRLAEVVKEQLGLDVINEPGTGAAGGLGYGLKCFANASLEPGFALFSKYANLVERIKSAALVMTGEGAIDQSTLMGKGVGEIAALCRKHDVPCIGLAGVAPVDQTQASIFSSIHSIAPVLSTSEEAMADAAAWLERLASKVAREFGN